MALDQDSRLDSPLPGAGQSRTQGAQIAIPIEDSSHVADARRRAAAFIASDRFGDPTLGNILLAVTEAATNILKHAGRGQLLLRSLESRDGPGLEVVALDSGPGITNIAGSMRDGHSTAGSLGMGMGSLVRASSVFDIYSLPQKGTALRLEFWSGRRPDPPPPDFGVIWQPKPGEEVCGDGWTLVARGERLRILVADGLGHGQEAARAAHAAIDVLARRPDLTPGALLECMHGELARTRGAAVGVALLDLENERGVYAGIGNIVAVTVDAQEQARHLISYNGIVGHKMPSVRELAFPFARDSLLILHSDGLGTHWNFEQYPGLSRRHPALIAGVLWRDFARGRDDVTVLALRHAGRAERRGT